MSNLALSCNHSGCITNIELNLMVDAQHSFEITSVNDSTPLSVEDEVRILLGDTLKLIGIVTSVEYDGSTKTYTYAGQDKASYTFDNLEVEEEKSDTVVTTLASCCATIDSRINCHTTQQCYGFGDYNGSVSGFVERIANSFGLHYIYNPTSVYVDLYETVVEPTEPAVGVHTHEYSISNDWNNGVKTVQLQKSYSTDEGSEATISNGSLTKSMSSPVNNSIPESSSSIYPRDVFIDPGTWEQVKIYANSTWNEYSQKVDVSDVHRIEIVEWSDESASPQWRLYIYDDDTELGNIHDTGSTHAWHSSTAANKVIIGRKVSGVMQYPTYDGVYCIVKTFSEENPGSIPTWQKTFTTGDAGIEDTNVIDEPMYYTQASIDGVRVGKRDSNPNSGTIESPYLEHLTLLSCYQNKANDGDNEFRRLNVPLVSLSYTTEPQMNVESEW